MNVEKMPLAQFRLAPTHEVRTHKEICVMVHKREAFYSVTPERMKELLDAEAKNKELRNGLLTSIDCALSAKESTPKGSDVDMYLGEILKCGEVL